MIFSFFVSLFGYVKKRKCFPCRVTSQTNFYTFSSHRLSTISKWFAILTFLCHCDIFVFLYYTPLSRNCPMGVHSGKCTNKNTHVCAWPAHTYIFLNKSIHTNGFSTFFSNGCYCYIHSGGWWLLLFYTFFSPSSAPTIVLLVVVIGKSVLFLGRSCVHIYSYRLHI